MSVGFYVRSLFVPKRVRVHSLSDTPIPQVPLPRLGMKQEPQEPDALYTNKQRYKEELQRTGNVLLTADGP